MKIRERQEIYEAADTQRVNNLLDSVASVPFTAIPNVLSQPTGAHSVDHCSSYRRRNISSPHREAAGGRIHHHQHHHHHAEAVPHCTKISKPKAAPISSLIFGF